MRTDSHKIFSLGYEALGAAFNITQRLAALKRCTLRSLIYIRTHFISARLSSPTQLSRGAVQPTRTHPPPHGADKQVMTAREHLQESTKVVACTCIRSTY